MTICIYINYDTLLCNYAYKENVLCLEHSEENMYPVILL